MEKTKVAIDEFLVAHSVAPFRATLEAMGPDKVKVTPWRSGHGCLCDAALELPRTAIRSVTLTNNEHDCCGKVLRVAEVEFAPEIATVLQAVIDQLASKASSRQNADDCATACAICNKFPWKKGPCSVCDKCS